MTAQRPLLTSFWLLGGALTLLRIFILVASDANLGPDESQYWFWSRDLVFGYFSKPPMIAWAIAATTALFGNAEWAVRLPAPLFHFAAAAFIYLSAKLLYDRRIAFWAGAAWLTLPGVILSSFLMTTDAPLLFFWSGALYFLLRIASANSASSRDFLLLGAMIGLGLLSKYAMAYFLVSLGVAVLMDPLLRKKLMRKNLAFTGLAAAALIAPNIWWNGQHDFQTLAHTAANANWGADIFKPLKLLSFIMGQFAVAGVIPFAMLLIIAGRRKFDITGKERVNPEIILLVFALTPLVIVALQAFISRAHANWAAAAYPATIILITAFLFRRDKAWLAKASAGFHAMLFVLFSIGVMNFSLIDKLGLSRAVKEIRGWQPQTGAIAARAPGYDAIVIDDRGLIGEMLYYQKEDGVEFVAIDPNAHIDTHYEAFKAFNPERHKRILFVTTRDDAAHVDYRFKNVTPLGPQSVDLGNGVSRTYHLFDISGYYGPGASAR